MKSGWERTGLRDLAIIETGKWDANHAVEGGAYRFYTCAADYMFCNTRRFSGNCLVFPGNGANVGEVYFYNGEFDAYQRTYVLHSISKRLLPRLLYYHFLSNWKSVGTAKQYGSATNFIKIGNFNDYFVSFPSSLTEQQRIVDILDQEFAKIDALKANAEKSLQAAKDLFQATLKKELEPKKEWEELAIPEVSENLDSKRVPITKSVRENGHYPYYGASGIVDYVADYIFDEPLLLVSEDGANLLARSTPIAFSIEGKVWVNNHAHVLRFDDYKKQKFVEYWFAGNDISSLITGAAQPKFNQKALNSIKIAFPMKEQEMEDILDRLGEMEGKSNSLQENYQKTLSLCDDLKQSLLRKAFNGEL